MRLSEVRKQDAQGFSGIVFCAAESLHVANLVAHEVVQAFVIIEPKADVPVIPVFMSVEFAHCLCLSCCALCGGD